MPDKLVCIIKKCNSETFSFCHSCDIDIYSKIVEENNNRTMDEPELKNNWFKTWIDNDYNKLNQSPTESSIEDVNSCANKNANPPVPLNKLLSNIPLAYSPITKQLHVISLREQPKNSVSEVNQLLNKSEEVGNYDVYLNKEQSEGAKTDKSDGKSVFPKCSESPPNKSDDEKLPNVWSNRICYTEQESENPHKNDVYTTRTETSSFSSVVSSLSDNSPINQYDRTSSKLNVLDNDDISARSMCSQDSESLYGENSKFFEEKNICSKDCKRKGLSGFFSRTMFGWKPSGKFFGKNQSHENQINDSENKVQCLDCNSTGIAKKYEDVIISSSALILHNRPPNLPAKSLDELQKHKMEYEQIVEAARKREVKESKKRKKQLQQQLKFEEQLKNASKIWSCEILPKWDLMKNTKKTRDLWWNGIPPSVRGKIWKLAIGNELNITYQLYEICAARAQERLKNAEIDMQTDCKSDANKESSVELIQLDISRTFPQLCIFQKGGPYYDILHCLLGAYVCYRPDVGYVQGMSFIAAVLILNLEPADAFICFANLLNRPCHLAFFTLNQPYMHSYYNAYSGIFKENLPKLCQHFEEAALTPDLYLLDWVYSVFTKAMPLDIACRIWDVFLRDGEEFIFRAALGILHLHQDKLLKLDFINGAQFLRKLPEDLSADLLFKSIDTIKMCIGKVKFAQILNKFIGKCSPR